VRIGGRKAESYRGSRSSVGTRIASGDAPVIFVTGADTGAGKTLLTGLLLRWLRSAGVEAVAIKPFCSGGTGDARMLKRLQPGRLSLEEISPYRFRLPLAPAVAAEREGNPVRLTTSIQYVERMRKRCDCLLIEGSGGLLSPLGKGFTLLELIERIGGHVIVTAQNRLGAINHVMLTVRALEPVSIESLGVVLMNGRKWQNLVSRTNPAALTQRLSCGLVTLPYLGENACRIGKVRANAKFLEKTLAGLLPSDTVCALLGAVVVEAEAER
jgi:dethiobiotin synthetase